jgi:MFS family permease
MLLIAATAYACVALLISRIPQERTVPITSRPRAAGALRDPRLRRLAATDMLLQLWTPVLNLGFPLWLTTRTDAGRPWIGPLYAIATALCVVLQVPATRLTTTTRTARRGQIAAGLLLALACAAFTTAAATHGPLTIAILALAVILLTTGELLAIAAAWTLSYALAPPHHRAEYLSAFMIGRSMARYVLGPILVTGLLTLAGPWTWPALAAIFCFASVAAQLGQSPRVR